MEAALVLSSRTGQHNLHFRRAFFSEVLASLPNTEPDAYLAQMPGGTNLSRLTLFCMLAYLCSPCPSKAHS